MAYRSGNYRYVVEDSFDPFSLQERFYPVGLYKSAYDEARKEYLDLQDKTNVFKYLSETLPEGSRARQIFEGYVSPLDEASRDFSRNGLSMSNQSALLGLRGRYKGEIGRLEKADEDLEKEVELRRTMSTKDPTTMYATDNLSIDNFLDRKKPNLYSVSGSDLYTRGTQIGASASSRIYSNPEVQNLTKYYQDFVQTQGYSPELLAEFSQRLDAIPEFRNAVENTLKEFGVTGNLTGANYQRAKQSVINGIINGSVYKRSDSPQRNLGVLTAAEEAANARALDSLNLQASGAGMVRDSSAPNGWRWDKDVDPSFQKAKAVAEIKAAGKGGKKGENYTTQLDTPIKITWNHNNPNYSHKGEKNYDQYYGEDGKLRRDAITTERLEKDYKASGKLLSYDELPDKIREQVDKVIGDGDGAYYDFYYNPYHSHFYGIDSEANVVIVPRGQTKDKISSGGDTDTDDLSDYYKLTGSGANDEEESSTDTLQGLASSVNNYSSIYDLADTDYFNASRTSQKEEQEKNRLGLNTGNKIHLGFN